MKNPKLGKKLETLRTFKGKSITEVAKEAGITPEMYTAIENGHPENVPQDILFHILRALDTSFTEFFDESILTIISGNTSENKGTESSGIRSGINSGINLQFYVMNDGQENELTELTKLCDTLKNALDTIVEKVMILEQKNTKLEEEIQVLKKKDTLD